MAWHSHFTRRSNFRHLLSETTTGSARRREAHPLRLEPLEERTLLSAVRMLPGFSDNALPPNDDYSTEAVDIGFEVDFFGNLHETLFVNNNGNVTFDADLEEYTPEGLDDVEREIIAPFWADVDTYGTGVTTYGTDTLDGHAAFAVNWIDVGFYEEHDTPTNSFQLVLIDRSDVEEGAFDIEFNYDSILWETGDASGGEDGLGGYSARAGYSNASPFLGMSLELIGSGVNGGFLDTNPTTGLVNGRLNSEVDGRYVFQFRGPVHYEFDWVNLPEQHHLFDVDGLLTGPAEGTPQDIALGYLNKNAERLGLSVLDLADATTGDQYTAGLSGATHIHLGQTFNGLSVVDAVINVNVAADGSIIV